MRHLLIARRRFNINICLDTIILALTWGQPASGLFTPGSDWLASDGTVSQGLTLSAQRSCSAAPMQYAVPSPVLLKGCPKGMYTAMVHVGNQDLEVLVDTGSSQLVLFGERCMGCSPRMKRYRPSASSIDLHMKDSAQFGGDHAGAYGDVYLDSVPVTGATVANVSGLVPLSLISAYLSGFDRDAWGVQSCSHANELSDVPGILGLGNGPGGSLSDTGLKALGEDYFVQALMRAGMPGIFSLQLCNHGGLLWLGGFDRDHSRTLMFPTYLPVSQYSTPLGPTGGYRLQVAKMSLGDSDRALDWTSAAYLLALVDTGNRYLSMPDSAFHDLNRTLHSIYTDLRATGRYNVSVLPDIPDCISGLPNDPETLDQDLPDLTVHLYQGPNSSYPLRVKASRSYMVFYPARANKTSMWCMEAVNTGYSVGSIGIPLLKNDVVVFDALGNCVGFVPQDPSTCPKIPSAPVMPRPPPAPSNPSPSSVPSKRWWLVLTCIVGLLACAAISVKYRRARSSRLQERMIRKLNGQIFWPQPDGIQDVREPFLRLASHGHDASPTRSSSI